MCKQGRGPDHRSCGCHATFGGPRMGMIFKEMLLSGEKVTSHLPKKINPIEHMHGLKALNQNLSTRRKTNELPNV